MTPPETKEPICPVCQGNDKDSPCAYPSEGKPGCLRETKEPSTEDVLKWANSLAFREDGRFRLPDDVLMIGAIIERLRKLAAMEKENEWHKLNDFPPDGITVEVKCDDGSLHDVYRERNWEGATWYHAKSMIFWSLAMPRIIAWRRKTK